MPLLLGSVEVQERRPRSWNEPRRKRLSFVRHANPRSGSNRDEWALVPTSGAATAAAAAGRPRFRTNAEEWDAQRHEAQRRFMALDQMRHNEELHQRARLMQIQPRPVMYGHHEQHHPHGLAPRIEERVPPPHLLHAHAHGQGHPHGHPFGHPHDHGHGHGHGYGHGHGHGHFEDPDEIIAIESGPDDGTSSSSSEDDHHHGGPRIIPLRIERSRDRAELPRAIIEIKSPKGKDKKHNKKDNHKKSKKKPGHGHHHNSGDSDSDSDSDGSFVEGYLAGRRASRVRGSPFSSSSSRSPFGRPRFVERRFEDDGSDDSMEFASRRRSRSGSRGRRH